MENHSTIPITAHVNGCKMPWEFSLFNFEIFQTYRKVQGGNITNVLHPLPEIANFNILPHSYQIS